MISRLRRTAALSLAQQLRQMIQLYQHRICPCNSGLEMQVPLNLLPKNRLCIYVYLCRFLILLLYVILSTKF